MPQRGPRICSCGRVVAAGIVCVCQRERRARNDHNRPTARQRGYDSRWQAAAKQFLIEHPFCACGCGRRSDVVDHIIPHRGDQRLFWDRKNWQPLAATCHNSRKQRAERAS